MFPERLITDDPLQPAPEGFSFRIRMPWYRALPLSCLDIPELTVDGQAVEPGRISVRVNGHSYPVPTLETDPALTDIWWFVTDPATVTVRSGAPPTPGPHEVGVTVALWIPYIIAGDRPIRIAETLVKTLSYAGEQIPNREGAQR